MADSTGTRPKASPVEPKVAQRWDSDRLVDIGTKAFLIVAILRALYEGFRMPSLWAVTLYTPSLWDGFFRRFVVGSALEPFSLATHYSYWPYAVLGLGVLVALVGLAAWWAWRGSVLQRAIVTGFFLLPVGGFLFNEVGYLDQILYLLLFGALWLFNRGYRWQASAVMCLAMGVHENALLATLPLFAFFMLRSVDRKTVAKLVAPPAAVGVLILLLPPVSLSTIYHLQDELKQASFRPRTDALALFNRTQMQSWKDYLPWSVFRSVLPVVLILGIAWLILCWKDHWTLDFAGVGAVAIVAPLLLSFGGLDSNRWALFAIANATIALFVWAADREVTPVQVLLLVVVFLLLTQMPFYYLDGFVARPLHEAGIRRFFTQVFHGSIFRTPVPIYGLSK